MIILSIRYFYYTVIAEINARQKQWFCKGGSTQNREALMGDFSKGGSTQNQWALMGFEIFLFACKL